MIIALASELHSLMKLFNFNFSSITSHISNRLMAAPVGNEWVIEACDHCTFCLDYQEICNNPQMFVGGASRFDIKQGVLGKSSILFLHIATSMHRMFKQSFQMLFWYSGITPKLYTI